MVITESLVRKLIETVDAGLVSGVGIPEPGKMCVEAAISYALGEPHSDGPSCVSPAVRRAKIVLNDAGWSSNAARANGMRRAAIAQLGSKGVVDDVKFATILTLATIREILPPLFHLIASLIPSHQQKLNFAAATCAGCADIYDAGAAGATARATALAAGATAWAAAWAAPLAAEAAEAAAGDDVLSAHAELIVKALQECGSPGCEWLWLLDDKR